jgi:hypothetical protein
MVPWAISTPARVVTGTFPDRAKIILEKPSACRDQRGEARGPRVVISIGKAMPSGEWGGQKKRYLDA